MAVVRVIMMQRDERTMLAQWINHYKTLFGIQNLTVMDNGSEDPDTIEILREAETLGMKVMWGFGTPHDFHQKGGHFGNIIKGLWDPAGNYDFALPVDCDELLAVFTDKGVSLDRVSIHRELDHLIGTKQALRMCMSLFNVPGAPGWFAVDRHFHKGFLSAGTIQIMDNGHHEPISRMAPGYVSTRLTYLHWHNRPFAELKANSRRKLDPAMQGLSDAELSEYAKKPSPGSHLVRNLFITEEEYRNRHSNDLQIHVPGLWPGTTWLRDPRGEVEWNKDRYLRKNPDVVRFGHGPLYHYVWHGWNEGRSLA